MYGIFFHFSITALLLAQKKNRALFWDKEAVISTAKSSFLLFGARKKRNLGHFRGSILERKEKKTMESGFPRRKYCFCFSSFLLGNCDSSLSKKTTSAKIKWLQSLRPKDCSHLCFLRKLRQMSHRLLCFIRISFAQENLHHQTVSSMRFPSKSTTQLS